MVNLSSIRKLKYFLFRPSAFIRSIRYHLYLKYKPIDWESRAEVMGKQAVLDSRHGALEYDDVTEFQKKILFPLFRKVIVPSDKNVLDFGCGVGRFSVGLAKLVGGECVGVDVSERLLQLCPQDEEVTFCLVSEIEALPVRQFDVIFCCLVLGGIGNRELRSTARLLESLLSPDGLVFLVESTGDRYRRGNWRVRTVSFYQDLLPTCKLNVIGSYVDAGQEVSIMVGRRKSV